MIRKPANLALAPLLAMLLFACASTPDTDQESSAAKAARVNTQLGQEYMNRGQYEVALDKLKKALRADPDYAPAHTVMAVLYERLGERDTAAKHYRAAVDANPGNGDVNNNYGTFLCRTGQAGRAERYFEEALEDPFYRTPAVAMANAGTCMLNQGNVDKAEVYLRQSLGYDDDFPDALFGMARVSYAKADYLRARGFLQRYEAAAPMTAETLMLGYRVETELNNPADARRHADRLLERFPKSPQAVEIRETRIQ